MTEQHEVVFELRLDPELKLAFERAASHARTTPSRALLALIETFVRDSDRRDEAVRQSRLVAASPDAAATMMDIDDAQGWMRD